MSNTESFNPITYTDRLGDLDFSVIHTWLSGSYWSPGISRGSVERGFARSGLVVGALKGSAK